MTLSFFVPGLARPKGSKRAFALRKKGGGYSGRVALVESAGAGLKAWEGQIKVAASAALANEQRDFARASRQNLGQISSIGGRLFEGPLAVSLTFSLLKPKSAPKHRVIYPVKRPDLDKLARSCLDAMTNILWRDDSQVVKLMAEKTYGDPPGVQVRITVWPSSVQSFHLLAGYFRVPRSTSQ